MAEPKESREMRDGIRIISRGIAAALVIAAGGFAFAKGCASCNVALDSPIRCGGACTHDGHSHMKSYDPATGKCECE